MKGNFNNRRKDGNTGVPSNGIGRNTIVTSNSNSFFESPETTRNFNDRLNYLLVNSIGSETIVTVSSGVKYSGLLLACNPNTSSGIDVMLKYPKVVDKSFAGDAFDEISESLQENLIIKGDDVAELDLKKVDFSLDEKWEKAKKYEVEEEAKKTAEIEKEQKTEEKQAFKTDVDISGSNMDIKQRELKKWTPEETEIFELGEDLEDSDANWDQFAVNEQKFGIKSTFDEHLYTTRINKHDPEYKRRLREAEKIAKDIESQGTSGNIHVAEDRGFFVDDSGMDEEDKYSGVDRRGDELLAALKMNAKPSTSKSSKYVPPTLRSQPHHVDPAIISSTTSKNMVSSDTKKPTAKSPSPPADKKSQIDELKKFSEKFKVPYDMPEEVKSIFRKQEEEEESPKYTSTLKSNPSLPPKPVSQPSAASTPGAPKANRNSKPPTPNLNKVELRKNHSRLNSQGHTPVSSPSMGRSATVSRRRNVSPSSFFGNKAPQANDVKKDLSKNFNMFLKAKEAHDERTKKQGGATNSLESFFIEKPYFTAPTWIGTMEQSYQTLFPDERTAIQKSQMKLQQRSMNAMAAVGNHMGGIPTMMGFPMGPGGAPGPFMNGPAVGGMYMPFQPQPMFYPPMPQMMPMMGSGDGKKSGAGSPSPNTSSPHGAAAFMNGGAVGAGQMAPFGYPSGMPFQPMLNAPNAGNHAGNYRTNYHHNTHHNTHHNSRHNRSHENR